MPDIEFFYGCVFDRGILAERAWNAPTELRKRLGHLDPHQLAKMNVDDLEQTIRHPEPLTRWPRIIAKCVIGASRLLVDRYDGIPEKIWNDNPRAGDLQRRFLEFDGFGDKISAMATDILHRLKHVPMHDFSGIDVAADIHVRRVFLRSGLIDDDTPEAAVRAARMLNPDYPGELDSAWNVGRNFCHPTNPDCIHCPLSSACPKRINLNVKAS
jgi:endonuclease III